MNAERRAEIERELRNILKKYSENVRDNALHGYSFVWPDLNQTVQAIISQIEKAEVDLGRIEIDIEGLSDVKGSYYQDSNDNTSWTKWANLPENKSKILRVKP